MAHPTRHSAVSTQTMDTQYRSQQAVLSARRDACSEPRDSSIAAPFLWVGCLLALAVGSVLGTPAPAAAQVGDTGWTVSLVAGSLFGGDLESREREPTYGGAVGLGVGGGVSLEAEVATIPRLRQFGDVELLIGTGSLLYHPVTAGRLTPYGLLGLSLARLSTGGQAAADVEVELALDVGGGVWLRVAGPFALRADVRFIHIDNAPNFWRAASGLTFWP